MSMFCPDANVTQLGRLALYVEDELGGKTGVDWDAISEAANSDCSTVILPGGQDRYENLIKPTINADLSDDDDDDDDDDEPLFILNTRNEEEVLAISDDDVDGPVLIINDDDPFIIIDDDDDGDDNQPFLVADDDNQPLLLVLRDDYKPLVQKQQENVENDENDCRHGLCNEMKENVSNQCIVEREGDESDDDQPLVTAVLPLGDDDAPPPLGDLDRGHANRVERVPAAGRYEALVCAEAAEDADVDEYAPEDASGVNLTAEGDPTINKNDADYRRPRTKAEVLSPYAKGAGTSPITTNKVADNHQQRRRSKAKAEISSPYAKGAGTSPRTNNKLADDTRLGSPMKAKAEILSPYAGTRKMRQQQRKRVNEEDNNVEQGNENDNNNHNTGLPASTKTCEDFLGKYVPLVDRMRPSRHVRERKPKNDDDDAEEECDEPHRQPRKPKVERGGSMPEKEGGRKKLRTRRKREKSTFDEREEGTDSDEWEKEQWRAERARQEAAARVARKRDLEYTASCRSVEPRVGHEHLRTSTPQPSERRKYRSRDARESRELPYNKNYYASLLPPYGGGGAAAAGASNPHAERCAYKYWEYSSLSSGDRYPQRSTSRPERVRREHQHHNPAVPQYGPRPPLMPYSSPYGSHAHNMPQGVPTNPTRIIPYGGAQTNGNRAYNSAPPMVGPYPSPYHTPPMTTSPHPSHYPPPSMMSYPIGLHHHPHQHHQHPMTPSPYPPHQHQPHPSVTPVAPNAAPIYNRELHQQHQLHQQHHQQHQHQPPYSILKRRRRSTEVEEIRRTKVIHLQD